MQAIVMVPMDPQKKDDAFYRYKMPTIVCKVEGNGNGIKTVFPNIHDVCSAIKRPESLMMKFFQFELGTQKTVSEKDDKFIVTGARSQELMQQKVYDFITKFVLCKHCRNPETQVIVGQRDTVKLLCGACGKESPISAVEKCAALFVQHYKKAPAAAAATAKAPAASDDAAAAPTAAAPEKSVVEKSEDVDNRPPPFEVLAAEIRADPSATEKHFRSAMLIKAQYGLDDKSGVRLVFRSIVLQGETAFMFHLAKHSALLARFCLVPELYGEGIITDTRRAELKAQEERLQATLIQECEVRVSKTGLAYKMPVLLKLLFSEGVLHQQSIEDWFKADDQKESGAEKAKKSKKSAESAEFVAEMRRLSEPLMKWLE